MRRLVHPAAMSLQINPEPAVVASPALGYDSMSPRRQGFEEAFHVIASADISNGERRALRRLSLEVFIEGIAASSARAGAQVPQQRVHGSRQLFQSPSVSDEAAIDVIAPEDDHEEKQPNPNSHSMIGFTRQLVASLQPLILRTADADAMVDKLQATLAEATALVGSPDQERPLQSASSECSIIGKSTMQVLQDASELMQAVKAANVRAREHFEGANSVDEIATASESAPASEVEGDGTSAHFGCDDGLCSRCAAGRRGVEPPPAKRFGPRRSRGRR